MVGGFLDCPHFWQLCTQISKYSCSLISAACAAFWHSSLGSPQPASLHSFDTYVHIVWTFFWLSATLFVRTSRHSSRASMHVRMYLNCFSVRSLSFCRVISIWCSPSVGNVSLGCVYYTFTNFGYVPASRRLT